MIGILILIGFMSLIIGSYFYAGRMYNIAMSSNKHEDLKRAFTASHIALFVTGCGLIATWIIQIVYS